MPVIDIARSGVCHRVSEYRSCYTVNTSGMLNHMVQNSNGEWGRRAGSSLRSSAGLLVLTNVLLVASMGCSAPGDPNDTWTKVYPYVQRQWACLKDAKPAAPVVDTGVAKTVHYTLPIVDWVSRAPVNGLTILLCGELDGQCSTPLPPGPLKMQDNRQTRTVSVPLPKGFTGFLKLVSTDGVGPLPDGTPDLFNAYIPEAYYFGDTVFSDRTVTANIRMLRSPILNQMASNIGTALDPSKALLALEVLDCDEQPASGVRFELGGASGEPFTLIGGLPKLPTSPETFVPTDTSGLAGFANVDPGYVFVDAFLVDSNERISREVVAATALPGQLTIVEVHARPFGIGPSPSATAE
jgi:hypothetical protein